MADHYTRETEARGLNREEFYDDLEKSTGWRPTKKFVASLLTGVVVFVLSKVLVDVDPGIEQAVNVVAMLVAAYVVPNDPTPGGVPDAG